jgi:hypothetical protein
VHLFCYKTTRRKRQTEASVLPVLSIRIRIPIAPTIFWGPMAFAIMGGLLVATVLTLIFLPALYVTWFRVSEPVANGVGPEARYSPQG